MVVGCQLNERQGGGGGRRGRCQTSNKEGWDNRRMSIHRLSRAGDREKVEGRVGIDSQAVLVREARTLVS